MSRENELARLRYQALSPEQKRAKQQREKAWRMAKHGPEKLAELERSGSRARYLRSSPEKKRATSRSGNAYQERHPAAKMLYNARERALESGVPFTLERKDIEIPDVCPILGIPLVRGKGKLHDGSPTIDRLDPAAGYTPKNIAVISHRANRIKQNASAEELEAIAAWMRIREAR